MSEKEKSQDVWEILPQKIGAIDKFFVDLENGIRGIFGQEPIHYDEVEEDGKKKWSLKKRVARKEVEKEEKKEERAEEKKEQVQVVKEREIEKHYYGQPLPEQEEKEGKKKGKKDDKE